MGKHLTRDLECDVCGAKFSTPQTLDVHRQRKNDAAHAKARGGSATPSSSKAPAKSRAETDSEPATDEDDDDDLL